MNNINQKNVILQAVNITKDYLPSSNKIFRALNDINLEIFENEIVYIMGESGAGKSTLLNILSGLSLPTSGNVFFKNKKLAYNNDLEMAKVRTKSFGFIFQFYNLLPEFTVLENVMLPMMICNNKRHKEIQEKARILLDKLGIIKKLNNFPIELSGGEKQRVAIARALINEPEIIFADEPTGNLDIENRDKIYSILEDIWLSGKSSIVLVSHDKNINFKKFRTIKLSNGNLVE
jgi:ABC-type lipoprotein export system ATPase subunit